jgi:hypothetical protein
MKKIGLVFILFSTILFASTDLKVMVNQKHTKPINLIAKTDKYVITYSTEEAVLKIWDRGSDRLVKEFNNFNNLQDLLIYKNIIYVLLKNNFYKINLNYLNKVLITSSRIDFINNMFIKDDKIFIGQWGNVLSYDISTDKLTDYFKYELRGLSNRYFSISDDFKYILHDERCYNLNIADTQFFPKRVDSSKCSILYINQYKVYKPNKNIINNKYIANTISHNYFQKKKNHQNSNIFITSKRDWDNYKEMLYLHNGANAINIYNEEMRSYGNTGACWFEEKSIYTTKNKNIIVDNPCEGVLIENSSYSIFDKKGRLLRTIQKTSKDLEFLALIKDSDKNTFNLLSLRIYADQNYIVWDNTLEVLDDNFQTIQTLKNTISNDVEYIEREDDKVTIYYKNNIIQYFRISDAKLLATKYIIDNDTEITLTPQGYFSGKGDYKDYIHLVDNKHNVYFIDQFFKSFYRPDLVKLALNGVDIKSNIALEDIISTKKAPKISFLDIDSKEVETDNDNIDLKVCLKDNGGGIGRTRIYLNNTMVSTSDRALKLKNSRCDKVYRFNLALKDGKNDIKVLAWNEAETMQTKPINLTVKSDIKKTAPNLYGLIVGIEQFENEELNLKYSVNDAKLIKNTIDTKSKALFKNIDLKYLSSKDETTKENILNSFEDIRTKIKPNDYFIFYVASHGTVENNKFHLLTSNVNFLDEIEDEAISDNKLISLIGNIPTPNKIVIFDTCYAGDAGGKMASALINKEITSTRGLSNKDAIDLLKIESGASIFSASSSIQQAIEGYNNHGLFTYFLAQGLNGKADKDSDGYVDLAELRKYVKKNVYKVSKKKYKKAQRPYIPKVTDIPFSRVE